MHVTRSVNFLAPANAIKITQEFIAVFTSDYKLYRYNSDLSGRTTVSLTKEHLSVHAFSQVGDIAHDGTTIIATPDQKHIAFYNMYDAIRLLESKTQRSDPLEAVLFSNNGKLFIVGDIAGRCTIYTTSHFTPLFELKPRADYISTLAISKSDRYLCSCAFNKNVIVYDIARGRQKTTFMTKAVVEDAHFLTENEICLVLQDGALLIYDINKKERLFEQNLFAHWPSKIISISEDFLLLTTRAQRAYFFNTKERTISFSLTLEHEGVTAAAIYGSLLYLAFVNKTMQIIDMAHQKDAFEIALKVNNLIDAKRLAESNPFLKIDPAFNKVMVLNYETDLQQAIGYIAKRMSQRALDIMEPHQDCLRYKEFETLLKYAEEIEKFYNFVAQRDLMRASAMIIDFPILKKTPAFFKLENIWNATFTKAKKMLIEDPIGLFRQAQNLLRPFMSIPEKKNFIVFMFKNIVVFQNAEQSVKEQKFSAYFEFVKQYPFLEQTPLYNQIIKLGNDFYNKLITMEYEEHYESALVLIESLKCFPSLVKQLTLVKNRVQKKIEFNHAASAQMLSEAFAMMDEFDYIQVLPKAVELENQFQKDVDKAIEDLSTPKALIEALQIYINIPTCKERVAQLLKPLYIKQMYQYSTNAEVSWLHVFLRFLRIYGESPELKKFAAMSKKTALYDNAFAKYDFIGINAADLPSTLLVKKAKASV